MMCEEEVLPWWKTGVIYEVYPRSFMDFNGDGVGDLKGITSRLDYFVDIGVKAIWLTPFYLSPMKDFGYDVTDFCDVDPVFGNLDDFTELMNGAKKRGLKVIVDIVAGHTSSECSWFKQSVRRDGKYSNYYIWSDGRLQPDGTRVPPNNWLSAFGGSAWTWHEERGQFYYHAFLKEQPTLNHRDPLVQEQMRSVLRYWLDKGVDGLRMDAIPHMITAEDLSLDEPRSNFKGLGPEEYYYLDHIYTYAQPEVMTLIEDYMTVLKEYDGKDGQPRLMLLETFEIETRNRYYSTGAVPFNMDLTQSPALGLPETPSISGYFLNSTIMGYYDSLPVGAWPNFVVSNHDVMRVTKRYGPQYTNVYNMLLLTLRGTPTCYYGEEIGMISPNITWEQNVDPQGTWYGPEKYAEHTRDYSRSPMQWDDTLHAGFTHGKTTWLPIHPSYKDINVKKQLNSPGQTSLKLFKALTDLRSEPAFQRGSLTPALVDQNVFSYIREYGDTRYLMAMNFGKTSSKLAFDRQVKAATGSIVLTTGIARLTDGETIPLSDVTLEPGDGLVVLLDSQYENDA